MGVSDKELTKIMTGDINKVKSLTLEQLRLRYIITYHGLLFDPQLDLGFDTALLALSERIAYELDNRKRVAKIIKCMELSRDIDLKVYEDATHRLKKSCMDKGVEEETFDSVWNMRWKSYMERMLQYWDSNNPITIIEPIVLDDMTEIQTDLNRAYETGENPYRVIYCNICECITRIFREQTQCKNCSTKDIRDINQEEWDYIMVQQDHLVGGRYYHLE